MASHEKLDIVVVGSCIMDLISYSERQPKPGETIKGSKFMTGFGGKGANQCFMAAKLGAKCLMVSKVGKDDFGNSYIRNYQEHGMSTEYVQQTSEASTAIAAITVSQDGQNCIIIVTGALDLLSESDVLQAESCIKNCKVMLCQLEIDQNVSLFAMKLAKKHGVKTIFNSAPAQCNINPEFFTVCDIFCANETEAEILTGLSVKSLEEGKIAVKALLDQGCNTVILTLGEQGSLFATKDSPTVVHVPITKVKAVDTTGAGDAYLGSLAYYIALMPELPLLEAIKRASAIAGLSVQSPGTQSSFPKREQLPNNLF
ncbi:hypothetical protein LOTGIDRAFT_197206 [Lottia gigantea]|uniref:Ribokinase n=1 Tax=Lottia gigantea TaxID=225164 RepID=V4B502_LOTGI|nr:hypothetical protein LOTGIDRAFT_197206 [Lottia gigantea]ESO83524.1 hypothetical protein LOTGIDRAFT_197206 [Lottia gigantea]